MVQLRFEVQNCPDSWLTREVLKWYDSLYRESDTIKDYTGGNYVNPDLANYDFSSVENFLISVGLDIGKKALNNLYKDVEKRLR